MTNKIILLPKQLTTKFNTRILTRKLPMFEQIVLFNQKATTTKIFYKITGILCQHSIFCHAPTCPTHPHFNLSVIVNTLC